MRFSTFHVGQRVAGESPSDAIESTLVGAQAAEALGFDACWVGEHHFSKYGSYGSPLIIMAAIAGVTSTIRIASGVSVVPLHQPLRLAEDFAVIDVMSKGRVIAGVGPGFAALEFNGFHVSLEERRDRFHEGVEIMRQAWSQPTVEFTGQYFDFHGIEVFPRPYQEPHPPIVHAATKAESQAFAARLGRPILLGRLGDEIAYESLQRYIATRREAGHAELAISRSLELCGVLRHICIDRDGATAYRRAYEAAGRYLTQSAVLGMESRLAPAPERETPDELIERGCIVGTPEEVTERIEFLYRIGVRHLICWFEWGGIEPVVVQNSMQLFADEVMTNFAKQPAALLA